MATRAQLLMRLQARQEAIADEWHSAIAGTSYASSDGEQLRQRLNELTGKAMVAFLGGPEESSKAWEVGAALADLHFVQPEALGRTLGVLGSQLGAGLPADQAAAYQPDLVALLEGLSTGFFENARSTILSEQEAIREALVQELRQTEQALRKARNELELRVTQQTADLERTNEELHLEIAERRRVEKALREREAMYRELVEDLSEVIYALDLDGNLTYASPSIEAFIGYLPQEVVGHHFSEFIYSEDLPRLRQGFEKLMRGRSQENEYRVVTKSGEVRWMRTSSRVILDGSRVTGVHGVLVDTTRRKEAEEALRESENRWRSLVENAPDFVLTVDRNGRILFVNRPLWADDSSKTRIMGLHVCRLAIPQHQPVVRAAVNRVFETGSSAYCEVAASSANGSRTWYAANLGPVWRNGTVSSVMLIVRDISERKKLDEIKDNLIRDVSHELRTPLAKVQMSLELLSEMLEREKLDREKARRISSLSVVNVERLLQTVEGILDLSRLEAGVWTYLRQEVRLDLLIEEVLQYMRPLAAAKGLQLVVDVPEDAPRVEGDWEKLFRVLINLVDNAVKFTDEGQIVISAESDGLEVVLTIRDTGQGVLPENLDRVFERFFQEKTRYQGVGVGLTISRAIVESHGGRIWVESPGRGGGATFRLALPVAQGWRAGE